MQIVRIVLIRPLRHPSVEIAREHGRCPLVVTGALCRVPRPWIRSPVINQIRLCIVRNPAPYGATADLPLVGRPRGYAEIWLRVRSVWRFEVFTDEHVFIRPGTPRAPHLLPCF